MKEIDVAKEQLLKCEKDEINQPDNKKLQISTKKASQKYNELTEKGKTFDVTYQSAVKKANEELESFRKDKMPEILEVIFFLFD
jgi:hypothetical protein